MRHETSLLLIGLLLSGCAVGPNYQTPTVELPDRWSQSSANSPAESLSANVQEAKPVVEDRGREGGQGGGGYEGFQDPMLGALIQQACQQNLDIQLARSRLAQARAELGVVDAARWPNVEATGSVTHQYKSRNAGQVATGSGPESNVYQAGFDASWELDLFGSVKRQVEAATADYQAAMASERQMRVTMEAEVARTYFQLRGLQLRLKIARENLAAQSQSVDLAKARFDAGLTNDLDLAQAQSLYASTKATLPLLQMQIQQTLNAMAILLGRPPQDFGADLWQPGEATLARLGQPWPMPLPLGLPSELLRRRPDIQQAERQLAAATARTAQATAAFYPRFMLNGTAGLSSVEPSDFFEGGSRYYSIGPSVRWPILNFGRLDSQLKVQNEVQQQALTTYQKTILQALAEVENALVSYCREQDRLAALGENLSAQQRAWALSQDLYARGLTPYVNVLDSQRQLLAVQDQVAQSQVAVTQSLVALFKSLGGPGETPSDREPAR